MNRHVRYMTGYMSLKCSDRVDGCSDSDCVCMCHAKSLNPKDKNIDTGRGSAWYRERFGEVLTEDDLHGPLPEPSAHEDLGSASTDGCNYAD